MEGCLNMKNQKGSETKTSLLIALVLLNDVEFFKSASQSKTLQFMVVLGLIFGAGFVLFLFKMAGV